MPFAGRIRSAMCSKTSSTRTPSTSGSRNRPDDHPDVGLAPDPQLAGLAASGSILGSHDLGLAGLLREIDR